MPGSFCPRGRLVSDANYSVHPSGPIHSGDWYGRSGPFRVQGLSGMCGKIPGEGGTSEKSGMFRGIRRIEISGGKCLRSSDVAVPPYPTASGNTTTPLPSAPDSIPHPTDPPCLCTAHYPLPSLLILPARPARLGPARLGSTRRSAARRLFTSLQSGSALLPPEDQHRTLSVAPPADHHRSYANSFRSSAVHRATVSDLSGPAGGRVWTGLGEVRYLHFGSTPGLEPC